MMTLHGDAELYLITIEGDAKIKKWFNGGVTRG